ncbi:MAG: hypothetical protein KGJ19_07925 [Betaproteobacteria bacterium]|nr:hypothetical protein [Betaproteobacteria bacterium]
MRIKSHWFKSERKKTPQEIAGAVAFVIWRIGDNALKNTRKADFEIAIGTQYFSFLTEFLVFLIQVADRIVYRQLPAETRFLFTSTLANRVAETLAENQGRLMGNSVSEHKQHFIDKLNQRAGEYAEFNYDSDGPGFAFTRYLAYCMREVMDEKDISWMTDQMMSIEAPEAVTMLERTIRDLFETEPGQPRRRMTAVGD